jgi:hypothetical protein
MVMALYERFFPFLRVSDCSHASPTAFLNSLLNNFNFPEKIHSRLKISA